MKPAERPCCYSLIIFDPMAEKMGKAVESWGQMLIGLVAEILSSMSVSVAQWAILDFKEKTGFDTWREVP